MYLGDGAYGVEAAVAAVLRQVGEGRSTLDEAAIIAGHLPGHVAQSPYVNMERAQAPPQLRRSQRMADEGYITQKEADEAKSSGRSSLARRADRSRLGVAPYFLEEVRKELEARYGAKALYENGLSVQTALDLQLQDAANRALDDGLRRIDKRHGFRKPTRNVLAERHTVDGFKHPRWDRPDGRRTTSSRRSSPSVDARGHPRCAPARYRVDHRQEGLRVDAQDRAGAARAPRRSRRGPAADARPGARAPATGVARSAAARRRGACSRSTTTPARSRRWSAATASSAASSTARRRRSARSARRSSRSSTPPRSTAATRRRRSCMDAPVELSRRRRASRPTRRRTTTSKFEGPITLRRALEHSRNVPAIKLMDALGPKQVIAYARRFGLDGAAAAVPADRARRRRSDADRDDQRLLGLPEPGRPHDAVLDPQGHRPRRQPARGEPPRAAGRDPRRHGVRDDQPAARRRRARHRGEGRRRSTGRSPARPARPTTSPTPGSSASTPTSRSACGSATTRRSRSATGMTGAEAALPIWIDIMKTWIGDRKDPPTFEPPGNIVFVSVDKTSGDADRRRRLPARSAKPSSPARSPARFGSNTVSESRPAIRYGIPLRRPE